VIVAPTTDTDPREDDVLDAEGAVQPAGTVTVTTPEVSVVEAV
jgi:hypothetical protein